MIEACVRIPPRKPRMTPSFVLWHAPQSSPLTMRSFISTSRRQRSMVLRPAAATSAMPREHAVSRHHKRRMPVRQAAFRRKQYVCWDGALGSLSYGPPY